MQRGLGTGWGGGGGRRLGGRVMGVWGRERGQRMNVGLGPEDCLLGGGFKTWDGFFFGVRVGG